MTNVIAYIGLGSNLGDSLRNVRQAAAAISRLIEGECSGSSAWITKPVGFDREVPDFCNAVMRVATDFEPKALLSGLQAIERDMGRVKTKRVSGYESRLIDLDIICYGDLIFAEPGLELPHPRAMQRQFVLLPLRELSVDFRFPTGSCDLGESLDELISRAPQMEVLKTSQPIL